MTHPWADGVNDDGAASDAVAFKAQVVALGCEPMVGEVRAIGGETKTGDDGSGAPPSN